MGPTMAPAESSLIYAQVFGCSCRGSEFFNHIFRHARNVYFFPTVELNPPFCPMVEIFTVKGVISRIFSGLNSAASGSPYPHPGWHQGPASPAPAADLSPHGSPVMDQHQPCPTMSFSLPLTHSLSPLCSPQGLAGAP